MNQDLNVVNKNYLGINFQTEVHVSKFKEIKCDNY